MLTPHNTLQQEGNINMTHQQGGGIPHAWLLTKHEMFMLSACGRVCGYVRRRKTRDKVDCDPARGASHRFMYSCITAWQQGRGDCRPLTKDTNIEQDKTLTFHQHLSFPSSFSHPLSLSLSLLSFDMVLAFPRAVSTLTVRWGKCYEPEAQPHSDGRYSKVS